MLIVPTELTENTEAYGLKLLLITARLQPIYWERGRLVPKIGFSNPLNSLRFARQESRNDGLFNVAEGGELCLTSGDRREPEE